MVTQEDKILKLLKQWPEGLHPTIIVYETGILQYNARINGLRKRFRCIHKNGNEACAAEEHIINKSYKNQTTKFFYVKTHDDIQEYFAKKKAERKAQIEAEYDQISIFI